MSKRGDSKKGSRVELAFCEILKEQGYVTDRAERSTRPIPTPGRGACSQCHRAFVFMITKKHDTFGLFDVIAKNPNFPTFTFYFQVACNRWKYGKDKRGMEGFPMGEYDIICMVRKMDRKPFDIRILYRALSNPLWHEQMLGSFLRDKDFLKRISKGGDLAEIDEPLEI